MSLNLVNKIVPVAEGGLMMEHAFFLWSVLFLLSLAIRTVYEHLKNTRGLNTESRPLFAFIFTSMCLLWISWLNLCPLDPVHVELPGAVRWTGFALFIAGMILALGAVAQLRGVENIDHLVTTGIFKKLRHPMYVGFLSWILGWSIFHGAAAGLAIGTLGIVSIVWWRRLEEARLAVQFGDAYQLYRRSSWF